MSQSNLLVKITSDGNVNSYNEHGVKIIPLSGQLPILHLILELNQLSGKNKSKVPDAYRVRHAGFIFIREDTFELIELPVQHIIELVKHVKDDGSKDVIQDLLIQIPK